MARKRVKRAIFVAALSAILLVMLMFSSTLAWFSDSKVIVNTFTIGEFDVDLVHNADEEESASIADGKALFIHPDLTPYPGEVFLFEPGVTFSLEPIRVKNRGTEPFNYEMTIVQPDESVRSDLAPALQYAICTVERGKPCPRPEEIEVWYDSFKDLSLTGEQPLEAGAESDDIYILIHMKEEAGNEFMKTELGGLFIMVEATQIGMPADAS